MSLVKAQLSVTVLKGIFFILLLDYCNGLPKSCDRPGNIANGRVVISKKMKLVKYDCALEYQLVGQKYSACVNYSWDSEPPICVSPGCPEVGDVVNGIKDISHNGSYVRFFCHVGYILQGNNITFCNGTHWNGVPPTCKANSTTLPATFCDFEDPELCGWVHDPEQSVNWIRRMSDSGYPTRIGPLYDHTLGEGKKGHYMFIKSFTFKTDITVRLISPVYPANLSQSGCFSFYYHMYGRVLTGAGNLTILVHPSSVTLASIASDRELRAKYTMFETNVNHGDMWNKGFFDLNVMPDDFQIVIEGNPPGYLSNIAIDDVAILQYSLCAQKIGGNVTSTNSPFKQGSCVNRCNIRNVQKGEGDCSCLDGCEDEGTCCADYIESCFDDRTISPDLTSSTKSSNTKPTADVDPKSKNKQNDTNSTNKIKDGLNKIETTTTGTQTNITKKQEVVLSKSINKQSNISYTTPVSSVKMAAVTLIKSVYSKQNQTKSELASKQPKIESAPDSEVEMININKDLKPSQGGNVAKSPLKNNNGDMTKSEKLVENEEGDHNDSMSEVLIICLTILLLAVCTVGGAFLLRSGGVKNLIEAKWWKINNAPTSKQSDEDLMVRYHKLELSDE